MCVCVCRCVCVCLLVCSCMGLCCLYNLWSGRWQTGQAMSTRTDELPVSWFQQYIRTLGVCVHTYVVCGPVCGMAISCAWQVHEVWLVCTHNSYSRCTHPLLSPHLHSLSQTNIETFMDLGVRHTYTITLRTPDAHQSQWRAGQNPAR